MPTTVVTQSHLMLFICSSYGDIFYPEYTFKIIFVKFPKLSFGECIAMLHLCILNVPQ